jgi:hypothetical protein
LLLIGGAVALSAFLSSRTNSVPTQQKQVDDDDDDDKDDRKDGEEGDNDKKDKD